MAEIGMRGVTAGRIRIRPDVKARLDGYLRRNPYEDKTDIFNAALIVELARREALEPKPVEVAA